MFIPYYSQKVERNLTSGVEDAEKVMERGAATLHEHTNDVTEIRDQVRAFSLLFVRVEGMAESVIE